MNKVRCKDCGFLSLRNKKTNELEEAAEHYRESGAGPADVDFRPLCFVGAFDLRKDFDLTISSDKEVLRILNLDRDCGDKFTPWKHGYTPKEHQDMLNSEALLRLQQELREGDRKWQEEQRSRDIEREKQRTEEQRNWEKRQINSNRIFQILAGIFLAIVAYSLTSFSGKAPVEVKLHVDKEGNVKQIDKK